MTYRMTKTERIARRRVIHNLWRASEDWVPLSEIEREVPEAWHTILDDVDCHEPKEKLTLYLDTSVAKAFKVMGKGYQARINRILGTWLNLQIARMLEAEKFLDKRNKELDAKHFATPPEIATPGWGPVVDDWPQAGEAD